MRPGQHTLAQSRTDGKLVGSVVSSYTTGEDNIAYIHYGEPLTSYLVATHTKSTQNRAQCIPLIRLLKPPVQDGSAGLVKPRRLWLRGNQERDQDRTLY